MRAKLQYAAVFLVAISTESSAASFDCRQYYRNRTCPEVVICSTRGLSRSDDQMAAMYEILMKRLRASEAVRLRADQRDWLADRNACGCDAACIEGSYERRIEELDLY